MTAMTAATLDHLSDGRVLLGIGSSGPQVAEGWHGQRFAHQLDRTREYVDIVRKALARERLEYDGKQYTLPLPDGPGKALKLMIGSVQERIPIYIAAIGPKNMQLTGEIADGWIPIFFSPEHVGESRELLEEGAARAGRDLNGSFDIAPTVSVCIDDDVDRARDSVRHLLALYVGGMGSRDKNFYNALVRRYGFEDAAQTVQDLYLDGKKDEAAAALPAGADRSRGDGGAARQGARPARGLSRRGRGHAHRLHHRARRRAAQADGPPDRGDALSGAPAPRRRLLLAAFGDPGHAFPAIALGRELVARGHDVWLETWVRWREHVEREGMRFAPAPEYHLLEEGKAPLGIYQAAVRACEPTRELIREVDPHAVVADILTVAASLAAQAEERPWGTLVPHVYPVGRPGLPPYSVGAVPPRTRVGARLWGSLRPLLVGRRGARAPRAERRARACGAGAARARARRDLASDLALVATFPQLEYPRPDTPAGVRVTGPLLWEQPFGEVELPPGDDPLVLVAPSTAQDPEHELLRAALEGLAGEPVRVLATWNRRPPCASAARAAQRTARRMGVLRPHDAALRRRGLPRGPRHGRPCAGLRRACGGVPVRGRPGRERRAHPLVGARRVAAAPLPERPRGAPGGAAPAGRAHLHAAGGGAEGLGGGAPGRGQRRPGGGGSRRVSSMASTA